MNFSLLSIGEVCKIVRESSNTSCQLDPVPTWLVKSCLDVLVPSITEIIYISLLSRCVPENWRTTVVIPLLKKPGLKVPITQNFLFSYLKLHLVKITSEKKFCDLNQRRFF